MLDDLLIIALGGYYLYRAWSKDRYQAACFMFMIKKGKSRTEAQAYSNKHRRGNDPDISDFMHTVGIKKIINDAKELGFKTKWF
ncbi:hypothetical protein L0B53_18810 (plasmid) [Vibrio sp. SS-MA-C1-2]|uniref:hypothetical protein n=1 Tax=Vibrio sp. SS-MA-C1-2 TaxID=2908646 RepID=UPI001F162892|nr:hypothetical protein [Vibrio sp. SS-MA-C1-2]UJF20189.1 hypothetical protein L0B53_18810 [Vibrio sp. SS-MA-C1-2]